MNNNVPETDKFSIKEKLDILKVSLANYVKKELFDKEGSSEDQQMDLLEGFLSCLESGSKERNIAMLDIIDSKSQGLKSETREEKSRILDLLKRVGDLFVKESKAANFKSTKIIMSEKVKALQDRQLEISRALW